MSDPQTTPPSEPTANPEPAMDANLTPEQHATPEDPLAIALAELAEQRQDPVEAATAWKEAARVSID